jgi:hypothetical protein
MKCLICDSDCTYFFSKTYTEPPYDVLMQKIGQVDYHKCTSCGFVLSKTHSALDPETWRELNYKTHMYAEATKDERIVNQPPYADQAMMLVILGKNGIINTESMLDYAAGYGTLGTILSKYFGISLRLFDPYVQNGDVNRYVASEKLVRYQTVLNSAMFEHVLKREDLDSVHNMVADSGCLIVHTLICENVPKDPNWFYLKPPVHTAFHTNRSMGVLMRRWGYKSSVYCPKSKSWVLLKEDNGDIGELVNSINDEMQTDYLHYKNGFVDYWKGF